MECEVETGSSMGFINSTVAKSELVRAIDSAAVNEKLNLCSILRNENSQ